MNRKTCKNPKCQKVLPEGYKHKYCEHCRNQHIQYFKDSCKALAGIAATAGCAAIAIATKSNLDVRNK